MDVKDLAGFICSRKYHNDTSQVFETCEVRFESRNAFGAIVREFQGMAVGYAYSLIGDFDLAEDAAQE